MITEKPCRLSVVEMTEMILPQHTNSFGTVFGGVVMSWVDIAAAICAARHSGRQVVTASIDALHFLAPIKLGWIVNIKASVNFVAKSSCEVGVKINSENPTTGENHHTASAYLTMVALDSHGRPTAMPSLVLEDETQIRRNKAAELRRAQRLELKQVLMTENK